MRAAIYARVSTERQGRDQTIDSQLDALRRWASGHGHELKDEHIYIDEGYSGARLDRPALDRLRNAACDVAFIQRPISDDPHDQLLLQIQGAIAEYERAVLGERFRRGKLQKARDGYYLTGRAPYGYRYVPRRDAVPGRIVADEAEAELVRALYGWLIDERTTI